MTESKGKHGYFVNVYDDTNRDAAFLDNLERRQNNEFLPTGDGAGLLDLDLKEARRAFGDDEKLFGKFRRKVDYAKEFDEWFANENNGLESRVRDFLREINRKANEQIEINSDRSHEEAVQMKKECLDSEDSDPPEQVDSKYFIRKLALDVGDFDLYKRAMVHEVSNFADILMEENREPTETEREEVPDEKFNRKLSKTRNDYWLKMPKELKPDDTKPAQFLTEPE
jgi:hypothetical protein